MEDKELRKFLRVLYEMVAVVKDQTNSNTERIAAIEAGVRTALTGAPLQFEQSLAATLGHAQSLASAKERVSEFDAIRQILAQPPE